MADKLISGLLNGIAKQQYFNDNEITDGFLKEQLYPELSDEEFEIILQKHKTLIRNLVYSDMEMKQLDAYLTSQMKRKPDFLTESEAAAVAKFWKSNKKRIHDVIFKETSWNNKLKSVKWRIDVNYENNDVASAPKAIFELEIDNKMPKRNNGKIHFELDGKELNDLILQVEGIESLIDTQAKQ